MPPDADVEFGEIELETEETDGGTTPYVYGKSVHAADLENGVVKLNGRSSE